MKQLTYLGLIAFLCTSLALLSIGCGCGDDDDDDKSTADSGDDQDASSSKGDSGSEKEDDKDSGTTEEEEDANVAEEDAGKSPISYTCGGENAECDLLSTDGCEADEGCQFLTPADEEGAPFAQCVPAGEGALGDECDDEDNPCAAGYTCNGGRCFRYCCEFNSTVDCPENQACVIQMLDMDDKPTDVGLCDDCDDCNPLTAEGCDDGEGCYPIPTEEGAEDTGCRLCLESDGDKKAGDPCDSANNCVPGVGCYSIEIEGSDEPVEPSCADFCDLKADPDPCEPDGTCEDLLGEASMEKTVGICVAVEK